PEPAFHKGRVHLRLEDYDAAIVAFQEAIAVFPQYVEAYYNLGVAQYGKDDYAAALDSFRAATGLNPEYANAYYSAGLAFIRMADYGEARGVLNYAKTLYISQNNPQWASNTQAQLDRVDELSGE
ncbi:MAG: tetratricopeptide repeat protein, partial [Cyanobacteria bacterium J06636_16]